MAIDGVAEEVALNLEEAAEVTRKLSMVPTGFFFVGLALGGAIGFYYGNRLLKERIKAEAFRESEAEIEKMREAYQIRTAAVSKPAVDDLIREKGYKPAHVSVRLDPAPDPVSPTEAPDVEGDWDWDTEMASRIVDEPYVVHLREFEEPIDGYSRVNYTYWAIDDVLCDEDERPLPHADLIVGQNNLKFGHGSGDPDTVFVRNDKIEVLMEITRTHRSYEEDVLGHETRHERHSDRT